MEDNRFQQLIEHSRDATWLLTAAGTIVYASPASERVLGYSAAELTGANAFDFVLPSDRAEARARLTGKAGSSATVRLRRKDGVTIWVDADGAAAGGGEGEIVLSLRDITEQRLAEQKLRQSELRFRALIENSADGFVLLDREGRVMYSGPPVLGFENKEFLGHSVLEVVHPDDLPNAIANLAEIATHPGKTSTAHYRARHADGTWRWMEVRSKNLLSDPTVGGLVVNYRDITERRQHEEESQRVRNEIEGILESIQESFLALDREWRFTYANRRVASVIGKTPADLVGRNLWELFPEAKETDFYPQYQRVMKERVAAQFEMYYPSSGRWFDVHAYPTAEGLSAYILDITGRKAAEQRFATQHAVTRILSECSAPGDIGARVLRAMGENLGWTLGVYWALDAQTEFLRCREVWPVHSSASAFVRHCRQLSLRKGEGLPGRVWAGGRTAWAGDANIDSALPVRSAEARAAGLRSAFAFPLLRGGEVLAVLEFFSREVREPDAGMVRLMETLGAQIGQFLERKRLEEQLHHTQKLEGLGILAGGVAHDFNNLLTGILANASLAASSLEPASPVRNLIFDVVQAAESASGLTRQLLAYAGGGPFRVEAIDLSKLAHGVMGLLRRSIPATLEIRAGLRPGLPLIEGDATQLQQVMMNLVINAAEAIGEGRTGTVQVNSGLQTVDEPFARKTYGSSRVEPGRYVYLEVSDNGRGMDEVTQARIFDPFFTTKTMGRGLGLAAVLGIVTAHKGAVKVDSAPGRGASFRLLFPVASGASVEPEGRRSQARPGSATVLIVDDEELVRRAAKQALERYGYAVRTASGGREALDILAQDDSIEVVVLDLTMPVMNGAETLECIRTMRPELPVVLSSGYNEADATQRFGGTPAVFLQKPYTVARLTEKVEAALHAG
jgi:PAS domain S-box-containing protein